MSDLTRVSEQLLRDLDSGALDPHESSEIAARLWMVERALPPAATVYDVLYEPKVLAQAIADDVDRRSKQDAALPPAATEARDAGTLDVAGIASLIHPETCTLPEMHHVSTEFAKCNRIALNVRDFIAAAYAAASSEGQADG